MKKIILSLILLIFLLFFFGCTQQEKIELNKNNFDESCTDSDNGSVFTKGTTTGFSKFGLPENFVFDFNNPNLALITQTDMCVYNYGELKGVPWGLSEYYCDSNGFLSDIFIECQSGCVDGACSPNPTNKDYNYWTLAHLNTDVNYCGMISSILLQKDCFEQIYSNLAVLNNDINICLLENLDDQKYCFDSFYYKLASKMNQVDICENIVGAVLKEACIYIFTKSN